MAALEVVAAVLVLAEPGRREHDRLEGPRGDGRREARWISDLSMSTWEEEESVSSATVGSLMSSPSGHRRRSRRIGARRGCRPHVEDLGTA